jgi:hypothetical protein
MNELGKKAILVVALASYVRMNGMVLKPLLYKDCFQPTTKMDFKIHRFNKIILFFLPLMILLMKLLCGLGRDVLNNYQCRSRANMTIAA